MRKNSEIRRIVALFTAIVTFAGTVSGNPACVMASEPLCEEVFGNEDAGTALEVDPIAEDEMLIEEGGEVFADDEISAGAEDILDKAADAESYSYDSVMLPYGLCGMPEGFTVDAKMLSEKAEARAFGMADQLKDMTPGVDYVDREIVYCADTEEYAKQVARAYNARLDSWGYGIAVATITDPQLSVAEAVMAGEDPLLPLPIVSPNHMTVLEEPAVSGIDAGPGDEEAVTAEGAGPVADWKDAVDMYNDPALQPGFEFKTKDSWNPDAVGDTTQGYQWMHDMIGTYEAWGTTTGSKDITVAVIDTGVDTEHEDLKSGGSGRTVKNTDDTYINPTNPQCTPGAVDAYGHGTHVAGIVGQTANNGLGGAGVAPGVNILGISVFSWSDETKSSFVSDDNQARAINYVAGYDLDGKDKQTEPRANIINLSLGGKGYNAAVKKSIDNAYDAKVTVLASMGNDGVNAYNYPAAYDHVISVAAVDKDGNRAFFSCYGKWADIAAPGVDIYSTWNGHNNDPDKTPILITDDRHNWYASWEGTSMACPVVAGACALYMSAVGPVDPDEMEWVLKKTATRISDKTIGAGIVNVAAMMPNTAKNSKLKSPVAEYSTDKTKYVTLTEGTALSANDVIRINAQKGGVAYSIVYTVNGKTPSFKDGYASAGCFYADPGEVISVSKLVENGAPVNEPFTFKAAYASPQGTVGKVLTIKKVRIANTSESLGLTILGPDFVAKGKSITYKASTIPANLIKQGVTWSISGNNVPAGVTINRKNGKLTVKKTVPADTSFVVKAVLNKDNTIATEIKVTVKEPLTGVIPGFEDGKEPTSPVYKIVKNKNTGALTSLRLYTVNVPGNSLSENEIAVSVRVNGADGYKAAEIPELESVSSRPGVAEAVFDNNRGWVIKAGNAAGTARITWKATDGSGKKASLTVKTIIPVSRVSVKSKNTQMFVAPGKSVQLIGTPGNTYGKPTIKKLKWDYKVAVEYKSEVKGKSDPAPSDVTDKWKNDKLATINSSGKITVNKKAGDFVPDQPAGFAPKEYSYDLIITGYAEATDDSGQLGRFRTKLCKPTTGLYYCIPYSKKIEWIRKSSTIDLGEGTQGNMASLYVDLSGCDYCAEELCLASSSKPEVITLSQAFVTKVGEGADERTVLCYPIFVGDVRPGRTETVRLTLKANDGTGKKIVITLKVKGAVG